jgi:hypothetical protein
VVIMVVVIWTVYDNVAVDGHLRFNPANVANFWSVPLRAARVKGFEGLKPSKPIANPYPSRR